MDLESATPTGLDLKGSPKTSIQGEQRHTIDQIKRYLSDPARLHGVSSKQVLVYGPSGGGKRQIATRAAEEIVAGDGRKLLVADGHTFEVFLRDYHNFYSTLTGERLPPGLSTHLSVLKIKHTLERRRHEWLMLLIDVASSMDDGGPKTGTYIPDRGQIIITCSEIMRLPVREDARCPPKFTCQLDFATNAQRVFVTGLSLDIMAPGCCPAQLIKAVRGLHGSAHPTMMFLKIVAANLRLLNVSIETYVRLHRAKSGQRAPIHNSLVGATSAFNVAMRILWQALADRYAWATRLLGALAIADSVSIPLELLRSLPIHSPTESDPFSTALDLLASLRLVSMSKTPDNREVITTDPQILRWVRVHIKQAYTKKEYSGLVHSWVNNVAGILEADHASGVAGAERWWDLNHIIWNIVHAAACRHVSSIELLDFLISVSELILEDQRLQNYAGIFIDEAQRIWEGMPEGAWPPAPSDEIFYIRIKQVRIRVYLYRHEISRAGVELNLAKHCLLNRSTASSMDSLSLQDKLDELEVQVLLAHGRSFHVEDVLDRLLVKTTASPAMVAQYHHWMADFLSGVGYNVPALQHSHATMKYWSEQPKEFRHGKKDIMIMTWLEKHAILLIKLQKYRGALIFLTQLLDTWSEAVPTGCIGLWRIATLAACCYLNLEELTQAEKLAIRMLEMRPIEELDADTLRHALLFLQELGNIYLDHGRHVEAEAISRFKLKMVKRGEGEGDDMPSSWWIQLVVVLTAQGRHREARLVRDQYQNGQTGEELLDGIVAAAKKKGRLLRDLYQRAMWAEEDGMLREWKMLLRHDGANDRMTYIVAISVFGDVPRRVRADVLLGSEPDPHHYALARKSRVLQLLGCPLKALTFIGHSHNDHYPLFPARQRRMCDYVRACLCRRYRPRSSSFRGIAAMVAAGSRATAMKNDHNPAPAPKLRQSHIDDYFFILVEPTKLPCAETCPCRDATLRGIAEYASLEQKLWTVDSSGLSKLRLSPWLAHTRRRPTFIKNRDAPHLLSDQESFIRHQVDVDDPTRSLSRCWRVVHTEFSLDETLDENYIIPNSVGMPTTCR
ncbi:hypothetical protein DV735_g1091, partial [Chaetothyriales sp. CBS 134920]